MKLLTLALASLAFAEPSLAAETSSVETTPRGFMGGATTGRGWSLSGDLRGGFALTTQGGALADLRLVVALHERIDLGGSAGIGADPGGLLVEPALLVRLGLYGGEAHFLALELAARLALRPTDDAAALQAGVLVPALVASSFFRGWVEVIYGADLTIIRDYSGPFYFVPGLRLGVALHRQSPGLLRGLFAVASGSPILLTQRFGSLPIPTLMLTVGTHVEPSSIASRSWSTSAGRSFVR